MKRAGWLVGCGGEEVLLPSSTADIHHQISICSGYPSRASGNPEHGGFSWSSPRRSVQPDISRVCPAILRTSRRVSHRRASRSRLSYRRVSHERSCHIRGRPMRGWVEEVETVAE